MREMRCLETIFFIIIDLPVPQYIFIIASFVDSLTSLIAVFWYGRS